MPYNSNKDLPESVTKHLPDHAQDIYREAFNHAYEQYKNPHNRRDDASREETAHKVAWAAVHKKYEKSTDGQWRAKSK